MATKKRVFVLVLVVVFMFSIFATTPRPAYAGDEVGWQILTGILGGGAIYGNYAGKKNQEETKRYLGKLQHDVRQSEIHNNAALKAPTAFGGSGTSGVSSQWGNTAVTANVAQDYNGRYSYTDVQRGTNHLMSSETASRGRPTRVSGGKMLLEEPPPLEDEEYEETTDEDAVRSKPPRSKGKRKSRASRSRASDSALDRVDLVTLERLKSQKQDLQTKIALGLFIDGKNNPGKYGEQTFEEYWPIVFTAIWKDERGY